MANLKVLAGKNRVQSILPAFLWEMGLVMTHGDTVYAPDNWKCPETSKPEDYYGAAMRHLLLYESGEKYDQATGLYHPAHAATSLAILYYHDRGPKIDTTRRCVCPVCTGVK